MADFIRMADALTSAAGLIKALGSDEVARVTVEEVDHTRRTVDALQTYICGLERALSEYVVLGNGKCIISAAHVAMGRSALAAKPE